MTPPGMTSGFEAAELATKKVQIRSTEIEIVRPDVAANQGLTAPDVGRIVADVGQSFTEHF
jgi:hypothetical protein